MQISILPMALFYTDVFSAMQAEGSFWVVHKIQRKAASFRKLCCIWHVQIKFLTPKLQEIIFYLKKNFT